MATAANGAPTVKSNAPAHLARVGSVANAPWFDLKKGNICHGILENVYERPDERSRSGKSKFFQIRLLAECEVRYGRGKEAKKGKAVVGQVINLNYGPKTKELEKFIPDILRGAEYEVYCDVQGEKFDIGKGQTMWPIDVRAGMIRAPRASEDEPDFGDEDQDEGAPAQAAG